MKTHQGAPFCYEYGMDMLEIWKKYCISKSRDHCSTSIFNGFIRKCDVRRFLTEAIGDYAISIALDLG